MSAFSRRARRVPNGGHHGTSFGSQVGEKMNVQSEVTFDINAGHPVGVPPGTAISECKPKLFDVSLTN